MTGIFGRLFGEKDTAPRRAPAPVAPAPTIAPLTDSAPLFNPTPGNDLPPFRRPFSDEKYPRPELGQPIPRRYPNWRELGYVDELDAAYWSHYRQRYFFDLEKRLTKAKAQLGDDWQVCIDALVLIAQKYGESKLETLQEGLGFSRAKARKVLDLLVEAGFGRRESRGQVNIQGYGLQVEQLRAWQAGDPDRDY